MIGEEPAKLHIRAWLGYRSWRMDLIGWSPSWSTLCPLSRCRLWKRKGCCYEGRQGFRLRDRDCGEALATSFGDLCAQRDPGSRARWLAVAHLCPDGSTRACCSGRDQRSTGSRELPAYRDAC